MRFERFCLTNGNKRGPGENTVTSLSGNKQKRNPEKPRLNHTTFKVHGFEGYEQMVQCLGWISR